MPLNPDTFESPKLLIEFAGSNFDALKKDLKTFFDTATVRRIETSDPTTGEQVIKVKMESRLPGRVRALASSCLNDLRHALDQACYAATKAITGGGRDALFPFAMDPADLERQLAGGRSRNIPGPVKEIIRALQPYWKSSEHEGGDNALRALGALSGPKKHSVILMVVAESQEINLEGVMLVAPAEGSGRVRRRAWSRR